MPAPSPSELRVAMVMASHGLGGLERHTLDLCNGLVAAGVDVLAVVPAEMAAQIPPSIHLATLPFAQSRRNPLLWARLWWALRRYQPHIVHAQSSKAAALVGRVRPLLRPARTVATLHGIKKDTRMFHGHDAVIAVSRTVGERIAPGQRVEVIYNGIPPLPAGRVEVRDRLRTDLGVSADSTVLLTVGRLTDVKGFDRLIAAMPHLDATLLVVGDGPLRQSLTDQASALGLGNRVRFLGTRPDVPNLLAAADLTVIPSRREGFSYVLCESLHVGTPVFSTPVPVACELLPSHWQAPADDPQAFAEAINRLLADRQSLYEALMPLSQYAREQLTLEAMVGRTLALYQDLLQPAGEGA